MNKIINFNDALYIATAIDNWKQITDKHEVSIWTDGDWDDYYFIFSRREGESGAMRMEVISLQDKTYLNLFKPSRITECGKVMWNSVARSSTTKISTDELIEMLSIHGIEVTDTDVYTSDEARNTLKGNMHYKYKSSSGLYDDIFNMAYNYIAKQNKNGFVAEFSDASIDEYVKNVYSGKYKAFEDIFVKLLIDYYKDMPYEIKLRLETYIKHDDNPLCPKECIGTALLQAFIKFDYVNIHEKTYNGRI